jgi:HipA-like protein
MARRRRHPPLNIFLNGRLVGRLRRESTGAIDFQYDATWLAWENAIPVSLSLPLREDRFIGAQVIAVFDNLLPDNDAIRRRLAERAGAEGQDAYNLLTAVGRDCVGALQFLPDGMEPEAPNKVKGRAIDEEGIADILANLERSPLGVGDDKDFRISIAGTQEKTALLYWRKRWLVPHGTTATTHILKPQIGKLESGIDLSKSVENEHLCLRLVSALGIPAAHSEIADFAGRRALVIERFDRRRTRDQRLLRLPQEDCCQALSVPPTRKYQSEGGPGIRRLDSASRHAGVCGGQNRFADCKCIESFVSLLARPCTRRRPAPTNTACRGPRDASSRQRYRITEYLPPDSSGFEGIKTAFASQPAAKSMGDLARAAQMKQGLFDAMTVSPPNEVELEKLGFRELVNFFDLRMGYAGIPYTVTRDFHDKNQRVLTDFMTAIVEAIQVYRTNREAAYRAIIKITRQNDPYLLEKTHKSNLAQYDAIQGQPFPWQEGIESMINGFHARFTPAVVKNRDARPYLDPTFVQRAVDKLNLGKK